MSPKLTAATVAFVVDHAFDALVLAGGAARRLDGADKPGLDLGGSSLLERVVAACSGAERIVVVGPPRDLPGPVTFTQESPPGAGPVAAVASGLPLTAAPVVLLLAADLPWIAPAVPLLLRACVDAGMSGVGTGVGTGADADTDAGVAALVDAAGRRNLLASAWRRDALERAVASVDPVAGAPVRALYTSVRCVEVPDEGGWGQDCDTWEDVAQARDRNDLVTGRESSDVAAGRERPHAADFGERTV
jgi:CTP:molybdopterin cytidylyltransferase MocA